MSKLIYLIGWVIVFSGSLTVYAQNNWEFNIVDKKSPRHKRLPGTHIYIIPSKTFQFNTTSLELSDKDSNVINITESNRGYPYFSREHNKWYPIFNITVADSMQISFPELHGVKQKLTGLMPDTIYNYIFGNDTKAASITVHIIKRNPNVIKEINSILSNIYIDWSHQVDPTEIANYTIDLTGSIFSYSEFEMDNFMYTIGGKKVKIPQEKENVFRIQMMPLGANTDDGFIENWVTLTYRADDIKIYYSNKSSTTHINGYKAKEFEFAGLYELRKIIVYHVILMSSKSAIVFEAVIQDDHANVLTEVKRL